MIKRTYEELDSISRRSFWRDLQALPRQGRDRRPGSGSVCPSSSPTAVLTGPTTTTL